MGCGESKQPSGGSALLKPSSAPTNHSRYSLLDTPEEQSARFVLLCNPPTERKSKRGGGASSRQPAAVLHPNPLAVELQRVYLDTRARVFHQQKEDVEATAAKVEQEKQAHAPGPQVTHVRAEDAAAGEAPPPPSTDAAAQDAPEGGAEANADADAVLPPALQQPAQKDFAVYVNNSIEQARLRDFTAFDVVEAVELFVGYVKHDLHQQQAEAHRGSPSKTNSHRNSMGSQAAATPTPSVPWTCRMQCTLSGDSAEAEKLLDAARRRWREEREASHQKSKKATPATKPPSGGAQPVTSEPVQDANAADGGSVAGGKGMLMIDAVFESALPGSFDHRSPWQLEITLYFAA